MNTVKAQRIIAMALVGLAVQCAPDKSEQGALNLPEVCGILGVYCAEDGESIRGGGAVVSTSFSRCTSRRYTSLRNRDLGLKEMAIMTMTIMLTEEERARAGIETQYKIPSINLMVDAGVPAHQEELTANINGRRIFWRVLDYPWEDLQRSGYPDSLQIAVLENERGEKEIMVVDALLGGFPTHGSGIGEELKDNCGWDQDPEPRGVEQRGAARAAYKNFLRFNVDSLH
ncbi:MAG TPA: hypothetical protein VKM72_05355, partial [Thermoanaerobaculia bacterium]|nr:hypothetical protein [Thermoanaerobaculia bacterium]